VSMNEQRQTIPAYQSLNSMSECVPSLVVSRLAVVSFLCRVYRIQVDRRTIEGVWKDTARHVMVRSKESLVAAIHSDVGLMMGLSKGFWRLGRCGATRERDMRMVGPR
jgi:hypothetical protein